MTLEEVEQELEITVTPLETASNTYEGIQFSDFLMNKTWVVTPSQNTNFNATIKFHFPNNTFTDFNPTNYKLYYRDIGDDGAWELFADGATSIQNNAVVFKNIDRGGQFIIAK